MDYKWILFCPQLPATPSSPRVMVWRRMHSAGAIGLDNGLWILPFSAQSEQITRDMKDYVVNQNGTCKVFLANAFDEDTEADILQRLIKERAEEYFEFKEQCQDFLAEIEKETARCNFSFAEFEENEQDFEKLESWLKKVQARDFAQGEDAKDAESWLNRCRQALQTFADAVFSSEENPDSKNQPLSRLIGKNNLDNLKQG